jgi:hypothetical protein
MRINKRDPLTANGLYTSLCLSRLYYNSEDSCKDLAIILDLDLVWFKLSINTRFSRIFPDELANSSNKVLSSSDS